jgi:glyoxylase-like metal-dependent hydrolase (beta-lactamase superfamily II)
LLILVKEQLVSEVKVLLEGYAEEHDGVWRAHSTSVLIRDSDLIVLVDPGMDTRLLVALKDEGLTAGDIDLIFLTHHHLDHTINLRLFPDAAVCYGDHGVRGAELFCFAGRLPGTTLRIIPTPGHAPEHCALAVDTADGTVVVAGDILWAAANGDAPPTREELLEHQDPFAYDLELLKESRRKLLDLASVIIPGHGKPFRI